MEKKWWIIIAVIAIILLAIAVYFIFFRNSFSFGVFDFSAGTNFGNIGEAANANAFENMKLNPFSNSTG